MKKIKQLKYSDIAKLRKHILKKQKGRCWICGYPPKIPCLDHHHQKRIKGTGLIRGVLCSSCNVFIAKSENNAIRYGVQLKCLPARLRKFADYLEKNHYPYLHPSEAPPPLKIQKRWFSKIEKLYAEKYPSRKKLQFPKSGKLTKLLGLIGDEFNIPPVYLKRKK